MSGSLRLVELKEIPEDENLRRQWNELASQVDHPQVFYTYEWSLAVQRAYGESLHPLIFLARDEQDSLCGLVALARDASGTISFLCATTGDYCDFLALPRHKSDFVALVLSELKRQGRAEMILTNLPADSDSVAALRRAAGANQFRYYARTAYICAQVALDRLERRPDGQPVLPRKKMVRRFLNAMGREAPVRLDHARTWTELQLNIAEFARAHVARFLVTGRISNMTRPERRRFLEELARLLSESGWVMLTRMMSGKKVYAWNYGFCFRDTWFWYQPTFDSDLEKYSPGFCLLTKFIEQATQHPETRIVDLGLGAEEYKDRVCNETRETLYISLKHSALQHYREIVRYKAAVLARKVPGGESAIRTFMRRWQQFREDLARGGWGAVVARSESRLQELLWLQTEVFFYEWNGSAAASGPLKLRPLTLDDLASAACQFHDDASTLDYLMRAASRLQRGAARAFALTDDAGNFLHFAWAMDFEGFFLSELNAKVNSPSAEAVMLFDCWTPGSIRGKGYYAQAVERIAGVVRREGKRAWIFSAAKNRASVHGLEKSGFEQRYSLTRKRVLGWQWIKGETPRMNNASTAEISAHI